MEKLYTQSEAAAILGYGHYRSLNKLVSNGELECVKRGGKCGRKLFQKSIFKNTSIQKWFNSHGICKR